MALVNGSLTLTSYLDLAKKELRNAQIQNLATAPSSPVLGQMYFDTDTNRLNTWNGSGWDEYGTSTAVGDVVGPASSVDNEVVLFDSTTGKLVKRSSLTGAVVKATSGVLSAAAAGTDFLAPAGSGAALTGITQSQVASLTSDLALKAPLASPTFTGTVTLPGDASSALSPITKQQFDAMAQGLFYKTSVKGATAAAGTLATSFENGDTIDTNVTLVTGDRILLKDQATAADNGIYTVNASGAPTRAVDADAFAELQAGATVFVDTGTANANTQWTQTATLASLATSQTWAKTFQAADITGQAVPKKYSTLFGNGTDVSFVLNHALGLAVPHACLVDITLVSSGAVELCDVVKTDANNVTVSGWTAAPASNTYRATCIG